MAEPKTGATVASANAGHAAAESAGTNAAPPAVPVTPTVTPPTRLPATHGTVTGEIGSISSVLRSAGLTSLLGWGTGLARTLFAHGYTSSQITTALLTQLQTQSAFKARFPGLSERVSNGHPSIGVKTYLTYEAQAQSMAAAAGLPEGFMSTSEIGKLIATDVSISELSDRLTKAYQTAMAAPAETRALLTRDFGVKTGDLAAYFLTPKKATSVIQNQLTAAQIGTVAKTSGFGVFANQKPTLTKKTPEYGAGRVTTAARTAAEGKRAGKPTGQNVVTALYLAQTGVSPTKAQSVFKTIAHLLPLTEALPGVGGEKTSLTENAIANYGFFGSNAQELANVEQARTAPFRGGGGYVESAKGVLGAGYGNPQGTTGT